MKMSSGKKVERKTIEKDRRIRMKGLCFKLISLIPHHHLKQTKELLSHQDQLDHAANYIKILRERVEELERRKKEALMKIHGATKKAANMDDDEAKKLPIVRINDLGSDDLEVLLISGLNKKFMLHQIISIVEGEGAQVVSVNVSTVVGHKIIHTLHAQVKFPRVGVDTSRITERIRELIF